MDGTSIYEIFRDIAIVHSNNEEWRSLHCFGVGFLADLNTDNLEQSFFRKEYFYSEKWNETGKDVSNIKLDFPMCLFEPVVSSGEVERNGDSTGDRVYKCTMYIADVYGYDRNNSNESTYAKRTREDIWRDTEYIGLQMLKEFNRVGFNSKPKFSIANNGRYETDSMFDIANKRLVITSFDFSVIIPSACIDGTFVSPNPLPPSASIPIGTIIAWDGGKWARISPGQSGYILKSNGIGELPSWEQEQTSGIEEEADPIFNDWLNTVAQVDNWNAAFTWGNHSTAGYATTAELNAYTLENARSAGNTVGGDINMNENRLLNLPSPSSNNEPIRKIDFDSFANSAGRQRGEIDCSTNPNYPASNAGDRWEVTAAGKIGGVSGIAVQVWDEVVCKVTSPGGSQAEVGANFYVVQGNIERATETTSGYVYLATNSELQTGTDDEKAVTSFKLANWWAWIKTQAQTFAAKITFNSAPRFSSTTAGHFLKVDNNKDLTSVDKIQPSEISTDANNRFVTDTEKNKWNNSSIGEWTSYNPSPTGFSSLSDSLASYILIGKLCFVKVIVFGTSNSGKTTFNLPFDPANSYFFGSQIFNNIPCYGFNNNAPLTTSACIRLANSITANVYTNMASGSWFNVNQKGFMAQFFYEINN